MAILGQLNDYLNRDTLGAFGSIFTIRGLDYYFVALLICGNTSIKN